MVSDMNDYKTAAEILTETAKSYKIKAMFILAFSVIGIASIIMLMVMS